MWDLRTHPGKLEAPMKIPLFLPLIFFSAVNAVFEKIWGTGELITSFDCGSIMLPGGKNGATDLGHVRPSSAKFHIFTSR